MERTKAIDEFVGRLKDPYYGRPVYFRNGIPIGAQLSVIVEKTGEIVNFVKTDHDVWGIYGTNRNIRQMYTKQAENLIVDYIMLAHRQKAHINLIDQSCCLIIRSRENIESCYV